MEKNTPTPREISKKLKQIKNLMKLPANEGNFIDRDKEYLVETKKTCYKIHDREVKFDVINPFKLPKHKMIFPKNEPRKPPIKYKQHYTSDEIHTICDIDDTFYKVIEGRPIRQFNDIKVYMTNIRDITLFKANAAYIKDEIIRIDTFYNNELKEYNKIDRFYEETKTNFVHFAKQSYTEAKLVEARAEEVAKKLPKVLEEEEAISFELVRVRNLLSLTFYIFKKLDIYKTFLFKVSPLFWKEQLNIKEKEPISADTESVYSLDYYKTTINETQKEQTILYFKKPEQLKHIFEEISKQCLNYMEINITTATLYSSLQKSRNFLKRKIEQEVEEVNHVVQSYEDNIIFMEEKAATYKNIFDKILLNEFKSLMASEDSVKLFTCVQYVNTQLFGGNEDPKDSITQLMLQIERLYIKLSSDMDEFDQEIVKAAQKDIFEKDIKSMNRAHKAQRIIRECDLLRKGMYASFEPPRVASKVVFKKGRG